jgi:nucleotide-binding universal stress UspA family protein
VDAAGPILLCYDGSDDARAALEVAASLFRGHEAVVTCFWQPFANLTNRLAIDLLELVQVPASINEREAALATGLAEEGAARANEAGLSAVARAVETTSPIDEAIIAYADEVDAPLIVVGSRGRTGISSLLLGDVTNDIVQRSNRPVFVVPSTSLASRRHEQLASEAERTTPPA